MSMPVNTAHPGSLKTGITTLCCQSLGITGLTKTLFCLTQAKAFHWLLVFLNLGKILSYKWKLGGFNKTRKLFWARSWYQTLQFKIFSSQRGFHVHPREIKYEWMLGNLEHSEPLRFYNSKSKCLPRDSWLFLMKMTLCVWSAWGLLK